MQNRTSHCCGIYYWISKECRRAYLPQLDVKAHTSIISTISRTALTQRFMNPQKEAIDEVRYTFPLYDGVSVVGFRCKVNDRVIEGVVKEKEKARKDYKEAVERGETAGLLEQLPDAADVFTTTVGNIPAGAEITVELTFLGELKHDAEVDGVRFTLPTRIAPRYGATTFPLAPGAENVFKKGGIDITVDATVAEGTFIKSIRSPSHPIQVNMGTTSKDMDADPQHHIASASLSLGSAELDKDFVLQVVAKDVGLPRAILESHPTIPGHRALMATLVPKFSLPAARPEIVFVCDRSGSMLGAKMETTIQALRVFVKSLPVGVKFNICSFGSKFSFLFPKSKAYSQDTLDQAIAYIGTFAANFGGTEMLQPIEAAVEQRFKDLPLEILLLTDGEIWNRDALFGFLNEQISEKKQPIRVFTLGIGNDVSHSLIEGVARAGNGFSQSVSTGEKLDGKVVRMLKGALSPHVTDYSIEVKYEDEEKTFEYEDFEIVESVKDSLNVKLEKIQLEESGTKKNPISLFDEDVDLDKADPQEDDPDGQARFKHLPTIEAPKLLQAPSSIPPLFAFNRTTVYLLMSAAAPQKTPRSVILRGASEQGPLELEILVSSLSEPGQTIHQLAARKAVKELEEGRGWLTQAKQADGKTLKEAHESRFEEIVEREAVRLGVEFQVGGKWSSFVAVEAGKQPSKEQDINASRGHASASAIEQLGVNTAKSQFFSSSMAIGSKGPAMSRSSASGAFGSAAPSSSRGGMHTLTMQAMMSRQAMPQASKPTLFGAAPPAPPAPTAAARVSTQQKGLGLGGRLRSRKAAAVEAEAYEDSDDEEMGYALFDTDDSHTSAPPKKKSVPSDPLTALISLQTFSGSFPSSEQLFRVVGVDQKKVDEAAKKAGVSAEVISTVLAILFFERQLKDQEESWELVVEKARGWVEMEGCDFATVEAAVVELRG